MFRQTLRRLSRGVILKRRLPREFGAHSILVSPESALNYWRWNLGKVDPFLLSMARELVRPGMNVWDIGANVGLFSFAAAGLGAQVLAVECDPWLANLLRQSQLRNGLPVRILQAAVHDSCGSSELHFSVEGRASNSLLGSGPSIAVQTVTLDSLLENNPGPDVLKIDVEGVESAVLRGGARVLQHHPTIFCEVSQNQEQVGTILRDAGYSLYAARAQERKPLRIPSRDTVAIPTVP
jgi:FkbM family methyltransferase